MSSLRTKVFSSLSLAVLSFAALDQVVQRITIHRGFENLELHAAQRDVQRVVAAIQGEIDQVDRLCRDWSTREALNDYVVFPDPEFVRTSLSDAEFYDGPGFDLLYVCDPAGQVLFARAVDSARRVDISLRRLPTDVLSANHPLLRTENGGERGVYSTEHGPLLVSSRPIRTGDNKGPRRGTLILGRFLDQELVASLGARANVRFRTFDEAAPELSPEERLLRDQLTAQAASAAANPIQRRGARSETLEPSSEAGAGPPPQVVTRVADDSVLYAYTTFADLLGAPTLFVRTSVERTIARQGRHIVDELTLSTLGATLLLWLALYAITRRNLLAPLSQLAQRATLVGRKEEEPISSVTPDGEDELGRVSRRFEELDTELADSRTTLARAARAAGMSEIANGVLHNVGNVLNSVNVSSSVVANTLRSTSACDLQRMLQVVESSAEDLSSFLRHDPRGVHFYPTLKSLCEQIIEERELLDQEVVALSEGLDHIKELVRSQQNFAGRSGALERLSLATIIDQAISISNQALAPAGIEIVHEPEPLPDFDLDSTRLLEVLVNLFQNAKQAIRGQRRGRGRIEVITELSPDSSTVRVCVKDDGPGIAPENLARIFQHGFTTRREGHGFGLHTSANAAKEMGGRLWAESEGLGRGATFNLEIPVRPRAADEEGTERREESVRAA